MNELLLKKVFHNDISMLDSRKILKSTTITSNLFEEGSIILIYLFCELLQILHFELFKITNYKELAINESSISKLIASFKSKTIEFTGKFYKAKQLIESIIAYDKNGLGMNKLLKTDLGKIITECKSRAKAHFLKSSHLK